MSRDKHYQKLLNSPRWAEVKRIVWQRTKGLCERCIEEGKAAGVKEGWITLGVDCHHIRPVEGAKTLEGPDGMIARCYDPSNIRLLCIPCHIKTHQEMRSHTKEKVDENKARARRRFMEANDPNYKEENETVSKNKRLGIFGTLNYDKLKDMNMIERKSAVTNNVKEMLTRQTMDGKGPQLPADDFDPYDITAEYTIIDCRYNKQGKIIATLKAQRTIGGVSVELTSFETVTT